ncbi:GAF domain-containing protein [Flammeovirga yaeyamensis]|uniref:GAF domain-containing protein n=1 Tax=Flammeovirga yaeyamensis TaxID=367791 RepID=A0AAX1N4C7_9BACT|nr:GAF domain-containing protein [Flammeovirga yaeyamensis]MBB3699650.1 putative methionine-R-sulfoxide reductase with GAF domain [Flammeovirga yaeyamensis]NMF36779.1 GAF domain-containing protein [Flammeovirga yaeyamensis]QWG02181.1 GAF domain-containing protein [Flammeovirga yaeyamensis]
MIFHKTVRFRLLLLFVINTTLLLVTLAVVYFGTRSLIETNSLNEQFKACNTIYTESEIYYKNFLLDDLNSAEFYKNRKSTNTTRSVNLLDSALFTVEEVRKKMDDLNDVRAKELEFLRTDLEQLKSQQDFLMRKFLDLGYKDWGMIGNMRSKAHKIEKTEINYDLGLLLTLRRHEKDFLLRGEQKYLKLFDESVTEFEKSIIKLYLSPSTNLTEQDIRNLRAGLAAYQFGMHKVGDLFKVIGRSGNGGLMKSVSDLQEKINTRLLSLSENISSSNEVYLQWMLGLFLVIFILQSIILSWFIFGFSTMVSKKFSFLNKVTQRLVKGESINDLKEEIKNDHDEIADISELLIDINDQFQAAHDFSNRVGEGEVDVTYTNKYTDKPLALDLIKMRNQFQKVQELEHKRNWVTNGMAKFAQLLREKFDEESEWYDNLLRNTISYVGASQGTFILLRDDFKGGQTLDLVALYAYDKKRYDEKQYSLETGLLGQVYKEKEMLYIEDVPEDYVNITSGMGESRPNALIILPLIYAEKMYGILEISSFDKFDKYQVNFLENLSEIIASSIADMNTSRVVIQLNEELSKQKERVRELENIINENVEN